MARLIPNISSLIDRKFGEVNYYVTQILSGHIYFRKYLHRMGKTTFPYCLYEESEVVDDTEHIVFESGHWQSYRSVLTSIIGTSTAANIAGVMIASRENSGLIAQLLGAYSKTEEERFRGCRRYRRRHY